jgi:Flp pilus assembly protein TadB
MTAPDLTLALGLGVLGGTGAWLVWTGWHPTIEPLAAVLARYGQPARRSAGIGGRDLDTRLGARLRRIGIVEGRLTALEKDLRILDRRADDVAASAGAGGLLGLLAGVLAMIPRLAGIPVPTWVGGWVAIGGAVAGVLYPLVEVKEQAAKRRQTFQQALSAYCISVDMCLQVGAGPEQALLTAADGSGWQFGRIRAALQQAQVRNEEPWAALRQLGEAIDVPDLVELARSVEQVAVKGATVGDTVAGIADSIQARIASGIETEATRQTVRMAIPTTMLLMGFMLLAIYPLAQVVLGET